MLGRTEREMIESALGAYKFNKVADPVVKGMSDISFMLTLASILTVFFPNIVVSATMTSVEEIVRAIIVGIKDALEQANLGSQDGPFSNPLTDQVGNFSVLYPLAGDLTELVNYLISQGEN